MKICYLAGVNSPHTIKWCNFFREKGHEVHLISFDPGEIKNINVHHVNLKVDSHSSRLKKIRYLFSFNQVRKIITDIKPDIIHAHRTTGYAYVAALSRFHPYVLSAWGSDVYDLPKNKILKKFVQFNLKRADYIFSTSNAMKKQIETLVEKEVKVTPFGVDLNLFRPIAGLKDDSKIVIGTIKTLKLIH
jgi:glycosyltransferase involved in cell wall biosynthesis